MKEGAVESLLAVDLTTSLQQGPVRADMQKGKERAQEQAQAATEQAGPQAKPMRSDGATGARPATG